MPEIVKYELDNGQPVQVTEQDVRDLLAAGGQTAANVTGSEIKAFLRLCQAQRLNPFTRDAYLVKYGSSPATIIAGKEAFTKRAARNPRFRGMEAGITVVSNNAIQRREGSMLIPGEQLVGGWCKVHVEGYAAPIFDEVSFSEYSTGKGNWAKIPATMIRKVALTHALREAFPEDLGGLYGEEEMGRAAERPQSPPGPVQAEVVASLPPQPQAAPQAAPQRPPVGEELSVAYARMGAAIEAYAAAQGIDPAPLKEGVPDWPSIKVNDSPSQAATPLTLALKSAFLPIRYVHLVWPSVVTAPT